MKLTRPTTKDIAEIKALIDFYAKSGKMLSHSLSNLYENVRDFYVYKDNKGIIGCVALHVVWDNIAEIRSLAVKKEYQGRGLGNKLVKICLNEAKKLDINCVFTLTLEPVFFEKLGFSRINKESLPHKIWTECVNCSKFPNCDEIALEYSLKEG